MVLRRAGCADILEGSLRSQGRAQPVDVLFGGDDALVGPRNAQMSAGAVVVDVVGPVVANEAGRDEGARRRDAAADADVAQDAGAAERLTGAEAELFAAVDRDAAAESTADIDVAEGVPEGHHLPVESAGCHVDAAEVGEGGGCPGR